MEQSIQGKRKEQITIMLDPKDVLEFREEAHQAYKSLSAYLRGIILIARNKREEIPT